MTDNIKMPPMPQAIDNRLNDFAKACAFGDQESRVDSARQLKKAIEEHAREAVRLNAQDAPAAPQPRDDGMPASSDERHLRRLLASRVAMPNTYFDDGEAHGAEHGIQIDFMREPVAHIDAKLRALNVARLAVAAPQPAQVVPDGMSDYELSELAHSAIQEANSFGVGHELFLRYFKTLRKRLSAPAAPAAPQPAQAVQAVPEGWKLVPVDLDAHDEITDAACDAGNLYRVDFCKAWVAALEAVTQPSAASAAPLQVFNSPRAKTLMQAFEEGWRSCADAEYIGGEAQNDAFNKSSTVNHCMAEDVLASAPAAPQPAQQLLTEKDALLRQALEALRASTPDACPMDDDYAEQGWHRHSKAIEAIRSHLGVKND